MKQKNIESTVSLISTAILGVLAIIVPVMLNSEIKHYDALLFPMIRTGTEGLTLWTIGLLFLSCFLISTLSSVAPWKLGLATMSLFPLLSLAEIIAETIIADPHSHSHNLWPIEWIMYGILTLPGILGAYSGNGLKKVVLRVKNKQEETH